MEVTINSITCAMPAKGSQVWHELVYGALTVAVAGYGAYRPPGTEHEAWEKRVAKAVGLEVSVFAAEMITSMVFEQLTDTDSMYIKVYDGKHNLIRQIPQLGAEGSERFTTDKMQSERLNKLYVYPMTNNDKVEPGLRIESEDDYLRIELHEANYLFEDTFLGVVELGPEAIKGKRDTYVGDRPSAGACYLLDLTIAG